MNETAILTRIVFGGTFILIVLRGVFRSQFRQKTGL